MRDSSAGRSMIWINRAPPCLTLKRRIVSATLRKSGQPGTGEGRCWKKFRRRVTCRAEREYAEQARHPEKRHWHVSGLTGGFGH